MKPIVKVGILCVCMGRMLFGSNASIEGWVFHGQTERPLPGTNILLTGTSIGAAADEQGRFSLEKIPPGTYTLRATFIGYRSVEEEVVLSYNEHLVMRIHLEQTAVPGQSVIVTAETGVNQALRASSPVAFTHLSRKDVSAHHTTGDLPDLIREVPGVWTTSAGLGEPEVMIRGFSSDRVRFLINDIPMNDPENHAVIWSNWAGLANITQSVEVQRGPGFSLYGANAFGGSVNITTMRADPIPVKRFRVSTGAYRRVGIGSGPQAGRIPDPAEGEYTDPGTPIHYTYSFWFNSGPVYDERLNVGFFFERKTGGSYILNTGYDGYALGLEASSVLGDHRLRFSFFLAPQDHNQAFALQDPALLESLGREYNRKDHEWQENHYSQPFFSLKHAWRWSERRTLHNTLFLTVGRGADQSLMNDAFDVETGEIGFQWASRFKDAQAFGYHAQYLYNNFGLLTTEFVPSRGGYPSWFKDIEVYNHYGVGINFFGDQHTHSFQNRRRRDHVQVGLISHLDHAWKDNLRLEYGIDNRLWLGHRESECWYVQMSNVDAEGRQMYAPLNIENFTGKIQSIYDYDTRVLNLAVFGRATWKPSRRVTVQGGAEMRYTHAQVLENAIPLLDFGSWSYFDEAKRTTADLWGDRRFGWCNDYLRRYFYVTPWIGAHTVLAEGVVAFLRLASARREPAVLEWYDFIRGPLYQARYYEDREDAVSLVPERALSLELGFGYAFPGFEARVNAYRTDYRDKIETVIDIDDRYSAMNAGCAVFEGVECELRGRWGGFDVKGAATLARNRWTEMSDVLFGAEAEEVLGKVVPFAPERMLSVSLGYTLKPGGNPLRLRAGLNAWDGYYGTYTNTYIKTERIIADDGLPYDVGFKHSSELPAFLDLSAHLSYTVRTRTLGLTFRLDAHNLLDRADNFIRAQYTVDYTRNDDQAGKYNFYVLQAPLFHVFFTTELTIY